MKLDDLPESIRALIDLRLGDGDAWPEPQAIVRDSIPVAPFHPNLLPKVLRKRVYDVAHRMQCPADFVAVPALIMLGSIIGTGCTIRPKQRDNWTEYPNLWGGVVAPPGALKSPAISQAFAPLARVERRAERELADARSAFDSAEVMREFRLEQVKKQLKDKAKSSATPTAPFADLFSTMAELKAERPEPVLRRFRTQDATVAKLGELLAQSPRGILVFRDELMGLLSQLERDEEQGARAFYLEGWNGSNSFYVDRIGRGTIHIPRLCLAVFGGIQPEKLQNYLYVAAGRQNDGLVQRFQLLVCPDRPRQTRLVDELEDRSARDAVEDITEKLAYGDFPNMGAEAEERGDATLHYFRYHPVAQRIFNAWLVDLDRRIAAEEVPILAEHLSKFRKLVPALSLIFHLVDVAATGIPVARIPARCLDRALRWAKYLESHARRIYGQATDFRLLAANALANKLKGGDLVDGFSERDVYRRSWHGLGDPELVRAACRELEDAGWIRRIHVPHGGPGRPGAPTYKINPRLKA